LILPSRRTKTAFTACFMACLMEVCPAQKNGVSYPPLSSFASVYFIQLRVQRGGARHTYQPTLPRTTQPEAMKNP
jgi:hypothetical protein